MKLLRFIQVDTSKQTHRQTKSLLFSCAIQNPGPSVSLLPWPSSSRKGGDRVWGCPFAHLELSSLLVVLELLTAFPCHPITTLVFLSNVKAFHFQTNMVITKQALFVLSAAVHLSHPGPRCCCFLIRGEPPRPQCTVSSPALTSCRSSDSRASRQMAVALNSFASSLSSKEQPGGPGKSQKPGARNKGKAIMPNSEAIYHPQYFFGE